MPIENFKLPEPFAPWRRDWWERLKLVLQDVFVHSIEEGEGVEISYARPGRVLIEVDYDEDRSVYPSTSGDPENAAGIAPGVVFAVDMTQTAGDGGDETGGASWTYTVDNAITGSELATGLNPSSSPHTHKRPSLGEMVAATHGLAYYKLDGTLVVHSCNEVPAVEDCSA